MDWDIREGKEGEKAVLFIVTLTQGEIQDGKLHSVQTFLLHIWSTCLGQYIILHVQIPKACQVCESHQGKSIASCLWNWSQPFPQTLCDFLVQHVSLHSPIEPVSFHWKVQLTYTEAVLTRLTFFWFGSSYCHLTRSMYSKRTTCLLLFFLIKLSQVTVQTAD